MQAGEAMTVKEAASVKGVTPETIRRYIRAGLLEAVWIGNYRITPEALAACEQELARRKRETGRIR